MLGLYNVTNSVQTDAGSSESVGRHASFNPASRNDTVAEDADIEIRRMPNEVTVF